MLKRDTTGTTVKNLANLMSFVGIVVVLISAFVYPTKRALFRLGSQSTVVGVHAACGRCANVNDGLVCTPSACFDLRYAWVCNVTVDIFGCYYHTCFISFLNFFRFYFKPMASSARYVTTSWPRLDTYLACHN